MSKQILIIHGGDAYNTYDEYISSLENAQLNLERLKNKKDWKSTLNEVLGNDYAVFNPSMPNKQNARYAEWKLWFEKIVPLLDDTIVLIGHSLGGIFLAKYLSENTLSKKIKATFLVAAPYNTENQHLLADFIVEGTLEGFQNQGGKIFIYHSKDDQVVPFSDALEHQKALPYAHMNIFKDRQHFNTEYFPELVADIIALN